MDIKVGNPGWWLLLADEKRGKHLSSLTIERRRASDEEEEEQGDGREKEFALWDDGAIGIGERSRVLGILALLRSIRGKKRVEFVHRGFNVVIKIRPCAVLDTRPQELMRFSFVGQPPRLDMHRKKLNPIAGGRSKKAERRL